MAKRRAWEKKQTPYQKRLASVARRVGRSFGRGPVSLGTARLVNKGRRDLRSKNKKLLATWSAGFAIQEASRTGRVPSHKAVLRNPEFWKQVDIVLAKSKNKSPTGPTARALVALGVRSETFTGKVGTSPDAGIMYKAPIASRRERAGLSSRRNTP